MYKKIKHTWKLRGFYDVYNRNTNEIAIIKIHQNRTKKCYVFDFVYKFKQYFKQKSNHRGSKYRYQIILK